MELFAELQTIQVSQSVSLISTTKNNSLFSPFGFCLVAVTSHPSMSGTNLNLNSLSTSRFFMLFFLSQDTIWDVVDTVKGALDDVRSQTQNFQNSVVALEGKEVMFRFNSIQHGLVYFTTYYDSARPAMLLNMYQPLTFLYLRRWRLENGEGSRMFRM